MALFAANPDRFMDSFSSGFEKGFMEVLQRRFGTRKVKANYVYNEYIQDKEHVHMNGTIWTTLTDFVKYLGRTGKCVIEEESGSESPSWWITWINRDPEAVKRQEASLKRREREKGDEAREIDEVDLIAARARAEAGLNDNYDEDDDDDEEEEGGDDDGDEVEQGDGDEGDDSQDNVINNADEAIERKSRKLIELRKGYMPKELKREEGAGPLRISLSAPISAPAPLVGKKRSRWEPEESSTAAQLVSSTGTSSSSSPSSSSSSFSSTVPVLSQAELLMREEESLKQKKKDREEAAALAAIKSAAASAAAVDRVVSMAPSSSTILEADIREEWIAPGIIVKVMNNRVGGGKYFKQKGNVVSVEADLFTGIISMLDSGDVLKIDQQDLETVVPALGKTVLIVNGKHRGKRATLTALNVEAFSADIEMDSGEVLRNVPYEHFSKAVQG